MGVHSTKASPVERALMLIETFKAKESLDFDEALALCRAFMTVAAFDEDYPPQADDTVPEALRGPNFEPAEDMYEQLDQAIELLEDCPRPTNPQQKAEYFYLKATCLLKFNDFNGALSCLHSCQQALTQSPLTPELAIVQERIPELLEICEVYCERLNHPSFQPPRYYEEESFMYAVLRADQEDIIDQPNSLLARLLNHPDFVVEEFLKMKPGDQHYAEFLTEEYERKSQNTSEPVPYDTITPYMADEKTAKRLDNFHFYNEDENYINNREGALVHISDTMTQEKVSRSLHLTVTYRNYHYKVKIFGTKLYSRLDMLKLRHPLKRADKAELYSAKESLGVVVSCGEDPFATFKLQLLLLNTLVPHLLAVIDESAEQILSGAWVDYTTHLQADVPAAMLYTIHAVADEHDVWLHTHGLLRFGIPDVEILNCSPQHFKKYHEFMQAICAHVIDEPETTEPWRPFLLANMEDDTPIIATLVPWYEALPLLEDDDINGSNLDRLTDHNGKSLVTFAYKNHMDYSNKKVSPLSIYDESLNDNLLILFSEAEHRRQQVLAQETLALVDRFAQKEKNTTVLVEIALEFSPCYRDDKSEVPEYEACWASYLGAKDDKTFKARLETEPFYINELHAGMMIECEFIKITNWQLQMENHNSILKPEMAYRLAQALYE